MTSASAGLGDTSVADGVVLLARELRNGDASLWAPWLRLLPTLDDLRSSLPSFAGPSVLADFGALPMLRVLGAAKAKRTEDLLECFKAMQRTPQSPLTNLTSDDLLLALGLKASRKHKVLAAAPLFPGLDLFNTAELHRLNTEVKIKDDVVELRTSRLVQAGNELYARYHSRMDNEFMLFSWGVFFEENPNELNTLERVECTPSGSLGSRANPVASSLLETTITMLEDYQATATLASTWKAPRCRLAATDSADQGPLRCSLARLAWERCSEEWGYAGRPHQSRRSEDLGSHGAANRGQADRMADSSVADLAADSYVKSHGILGQMRQTKEDIAGAEQHFQAALRINPLHAPSLNLFALLLIRTGNSAGAERNLRLACSVDPGDAVAHTNLGNVLLTAGELAGARLSYGNALRVNPQQALAHNNVGRSLEAMGELGGAEESYRVALELDPGYETARGNIDRLRTRGGR